MHKCPPAWHVTKRNLQISLYFCSDCIHPHRGSVAANVNTAAPKAESTQARDELAKLLLSLSLAVRMFQDGFLYFIKEHYTFPSKHLHIMWLHGCKYPPCNFVKYLLKINVLRIEQGEFIRTTWWRGRQMDPQKTEETSGDLDEPGQKSQYI